MSVLQAPGNSQLLLFVWSDLRMGAAICAGCGEMHFLDVSLRVGSQAGANQLGVLGAQKVFAYAEEMIVLEMAPVRVLYS